MGGVMVSYSKLNSQKLDQLEKNLQMWALWHIFCNASDEDKSFTH